MRKDGSAKYCIPFGWHVPSQRMVAVTEVANGRACECICVACGVRLRARQGTIRVWHFAHDEVTDCQHAPEAAIHRMAKQMIAERGGVFVPNREISRTIYGRKRVWSEKISVELQSGGLISLSDCEQEKTIVDSQSNGEFRRPDVFALLEGRPIAIEILNTHAVDFDKLKWFEQRKHSLLEIDISDIEQLPLDEIPDALAVRLFQTSDHSSWLAHAKDSEGRLMLDQLEEQVRAMRSEEEKVLLARIDAQEMEAKRREAFRRQFRDIDDWKIRIGNCTIRIGRNGQRVSLKIHGHASDAVFQGIKSLAHRHRGQFNGKVLCWEFFRQSDNEVFFKQLCAKVQQECLDGFCVSPQPSWQQNAVIHRVEAFLALPVYFDDQALQEAFDERAGILEFEAGFDRKEAERRALAEITASFSSKGE